MKTTVKTVAIDRPVVLPTNKNAGGDSNTNTSIAKPGSKTPLSSSTVERWTLREESPPTIDPNSEVLLFIHGMDSRAEEADDITKALFALVANKPESQQVISPTPGSGLSPNPQMVAVLQQLLQKYKGCILERYETQQDMRNRGLDGNLSGLWNTNGLINRDNVKKLWRILLRLSEMFQARVQSILSSNWKTMPIKSPSAAF